MCVYIYIRLWKFCASSSYVYKCYFINKLRVTAYLSIIVIHLHTFVTMLIHNMCDYE